ncbi:LOW QUALITY PROTEIN: RE1-silencing transcription factor [Acanthochromis polyacanthus]|uniref:LOW QUALITY PROTEIN: RE1-silencing transcription factor n=1 Tax=Acanthochromis polyacanthus TaxID=80966 RepID=UPI0022342E2B|nr:LOW QUALITY PROTEIN: RE1-silencing transcription factor [Acanthochromis polyacanthus]
MAAQTVFSVEMFPAVGVSLMEDGQSLSDMPRNTLPAPQLVMLANVAAVTAAESGGGGEGSAADEKEMMELKTVGCSSYSDSEDESIIRYSYDNHNQREVCIIEYPESPGLPAEGVVVGHSAEGNGGDKAENLSRRPQPHPPAAKPPQQGAKHKEPPGATESAKKKKPFHCKPCHFQAQNEQEFVEHLGTHSISKMLVVNRVEGRSKTKAKEAEARVPGSSRSGGADSGGGEAAAAAGDIKGLIRCERCGYNTNRYDHYIAHLKHHSKEGEDHRVFKCTLCPYTTVSQYHWRKHLRNHFPSKLHTCSQCSYFSDRKSNYIQHIRTHTGVRPFQCLYCDYSSSQKTHLTRHMRTHSGERPFKCESCTYLAANQHEVTRHARQVHNGPKPLSCPYCEYKTADRSNFKKHVELHLNPRQFLCPLCKYAASKKCNLQYHIKSRHSGCNVAVDVSKVKLRVKKPGPDEENADSNANKEEDFDMDEDSSPINLSIRKTGRSGQSVGQTPDKAQTSKSNITCTEKSSKVKDKPVEPEKKIATRQKKVNGSPAENTLVKETQTEVTPATHTNTNKVKRRVKNKDKVAVQDQADALQKPQTEPEKPDHQHQRSDEARSVTLKVNQQNNSSSGSENRSLLSKPRKKSEKTPEHVDEAQTGLDHWRRPQKDKLLTKDKAAKRKAVSTALDLSSKSSSETPPKTRRLKALKSASEDITETIESSLTKKKKKKAKSSNKKATSLPKERSASSVIRLSSEAPEASAQVDDLTPAATTTASPTEPTAFTDQNSEKTCNVSPSSSSSSEDTPSVDRPVPTPPPPPPSSLKAADPEDDEGIHSSHEGGSDISDSASEGSDDSGLNGTGATVSAKMANDPETPTNEIPTPTELKSHLCIFCDRTFPLEGEYRRHLNRHLVNVYYMDAKAQK